MPTLLLRLVGPMQSWGTTSRFDQRDTGKEPSKSGVVGLIAAAMGIDRDNWTDLEPLTHVALGVRHDRPGMPKRDYQTAQRIISADRSKIHETAVTTRDYLADAAFLVGVAAEDNALLGRLHAALRLNRGVEPRVLAPSAPANHRAGLSRSRVPARPRHRRRWAVQPYLVPRPLLPGSWQVARWPARRHRCMPDAAADCTKG